MRCGDFVYHPIIDREKLRIDLSMVLPSLSWKGGIIQRSIDLYPLTTPDFHSANYNKFDWLRLKATYPCDASSELIEAGRSSLQRFNMFHGIIHDSLRWNKRLLNFSIRQNQHRK